MRKELRMRRAWRRERWVARRGGKGKEDYARSMIRLVRTDCLTDCPLAVSYYRRPASFSLLYAFYILALLSVIFLSVTSQPLRWSVTRPPSLNLVIQSLSPYLVFFFAKFRCRDPRSPPPLCPVYVSHHFLLPFVDSAPTCFPSPFPLFSPSLSFHDIQSIELILNSPAVLSTSFIRFESSASFYNFFHYCLGDNHLRLAKHPPPLKIPSNLLCATQITSVTHIWRRSSFALLQIQ